MNKKLIYIAIVLLTLTACNGQNSSDTDSNNTNNNTQQNESVTWKFKFPSLWGVAYASDINPEDVTYEQFVNAVVEKLKTDVDFKDNIKGDTGEQGIIGPAGEQGIQGIPGQDGTDATLPSWETMYTFGNGDAFFYTCNTNNPCTANDITFHTTTLSNTVVYYHAANPSGGSFIGTDLLNTSASITNIHANSDCEYKAELLTANSGIDKVLTSPEIQNGNLTFKTQSAFSSEFEVKIGDASASLIKPLLVVSKRLPASFSATQEEKDRIAHELTTVGTHLGWQLVLKRRCR